MNTTHSQKVNSVKRKTGGQTSVKARTKPSQTQRERVASKEEAMIVAAHAMLTAQGFAKTTMSDIAKRAGVAEGTLYLYFNNKEALARAVLADFYRRLTAAARRGVEKSETTADKLSFLARHHLESILRERRLLEIVATTDRNVESYGGSEIYKMNREYVAVFDGVMRDGVLKGEIADGGASWIARDIFFGGLEYAMRTILIKKRTAKKDITAVVDRLVMMLIGGDAAAGKSQVVSGKDLANAVKRVDAAALRLERLAAKTK
ncbi:MAG: TetR/AcrR family transcriptional regulator [Pseudomonadota bacterium]